MTIHPCGAPGGRRKTLSTPIRNRRRNYGTFTKNQPEEIGEQKELEDVENRISELEDEMQLFKNLMVKSSSNDTTKRMTLAEESL